MNRSEFELSRQPFDIEKQQSQSSGLSHMRHLSSVLCLMLLAQTTSPAVGAPTRSPESPRRSVSAPIRWNESLQPIEGFGASADYFVRDFAAFPKHSRERVLDALFSTTRGAGLSIVRNRLWDGSCDGPDTRCAIKPTPLTHNPAPGIWEFDCPASERSGRCTPGRPKDQWQIWFADSAKRRANDIKFLFSVWSPPGWMKDTGRADGGGRLLRSRYPDYAAYLSRNLREYESRYRLVTNVISVQNEPGLSGLTATTLWSPDEMRDFVRDHLGPRLAADGVKTRIMVAEDQYWGEMSAASTLADPKAAAQVAVFGGHNYNEGATEFGGVARPIRLGAMAGRPLWMTEVCRHGAGIPFDPSIDDALGWAKSIHEFMTVANASAWLYWRFQRPTGPGSVTWSAGGKEALVSMVPETREILIAKRLWAMGQFSRFVRPGFVRVAAPAEPAPGVHLSAYRDARRQAGEGRSGVVVAINGGATPIMVDLSSLRVRSVYRTSGTENLARLPGGRGRSSSIALAPRSITTFIGNPVEDHGSGTP